MKEVNQKNHFKIKCGSKARVTKEGTGSMEYVLITGGTSGIGFELARIFAGNGCGVVLVSSNEKRLENTKMKLENELKAVVRTYQQDLGKTGAALQLYNHIREDQLDISILVNNAGVGLLGPTEQIALDCDEHMLLLNTVNVVELCKLFLPEMYRRGNGKILNVSSTGAFQPGPYTSTYYASKAFVLSYSRAIRYEARKRDVQICTLCPGATKTDFFVREKAKIPYGAMSAESVAKYAYKQFMKNKEVIVPGAANKLIRWVPAKLRMDAIAKMKQKRPG